MDEENNINTLHIYEDSPSCKKFSEYSSSTINIFFNDSQIIETQNFNSSSQIDELNDSLTK